MTDLPTSGQLGLLAAAVGAFAAGGVVSLSRLRWNREGLRVAAKACMYFAILLAAGVLAWHCQTRGNWLPLGDNFDVLIWLALLLAVFVAYTQRVHPLRGLDWFVMPIVILLLVAAGVFGRTEPREYLGTTWSWLHWVTSFGGVAAFAIGGAAGAMYLFTSRRLRAKRITPGQNLGSLERLEHITVVSVTLGFALLTIGLITGLVRALQEPNSRLGADWYEQPKVILTFIAWVLYALVLHSPITPSFRGRKTALLSVVGFIVMIGVIVAVQLMPGR